MNFLKSYREIKILQYNDENWKTDIIDFNGIFQLLTDLEIFLSPMKPETYLISLGAYLKIRPQWKWTIFIYIFGSELSYVSKDIVGSQWLLSSCHSWGRFWCSLEPLKKNGIHNCKFPMETSSSDRWKTETYPLNFTVLSPLSILDRMKCYIYCYR